MKYLLYTIVVLLFLSKSASAQVFTYVEASRDDNMESYTNSYVINLFGNMYEIVESTYTRSGWCAQISSGVISYGFAVHYKDTVILHDVDCSYNMKLCVKDSTLRLIQGFEHMKNMIFKKSADSGKRQFDDKYLVTEQLRMLKSSSVPAKMLYDQQYKNDSKHLFSTGIYAYKYDDKLLHSFMLFKEDTYEIKQGNNMISFGNWHRAGNLIILKDGSLNSYFTYTIVKDNHIVSESTPYFFQTDLQLRSK